MEPPKTDTPKRPDMVMCGDHPSITKTELNVKEERPEEKQEKDKKEKLPMSYAKISPSTSRTDRGSLEQKCRALSNHALRLMDARRHVRSLEVVSRHDDINAPANRALVQAALGTFRWPPYLVAVWVLVLLLTHALHCLVTVLERALPALHAWCAYTRAWAESLWRGGAARSALALAGGAGALHALYAALYALHALALWAVEPLCADVREGETKTTDYVADVGSNVNSSLDE